MKQTQVITFFLMLALPFSAVAEDYYHTRGTWYFNFSGIPFAKLWLALEEDAQGYDLTASFKSRGIVRIFKKMKSLSKSHGIRTERGMQALLFHFTNKDESKQTKLVYDETGIITERIVEPEDDPWHRPPVRPEEAYGAESAGDVIFALRDMMQQQVTQPGDEASLHLYDGQRLAEIMLHYVGEKTLEIDDVPVTTYELHVSRNLINGFTQKEIKRYKEGDPPVFLYLRKSDYFPVAVEARLPYGTLTARWEKEK